MANLEAWRRGAKQAGQNYSVSLCAVGPDDMNREVAVTGKGDNVGGAAVSARRLTVPHSYELRRSIKHGLAGRHVGIAGRRRVGQRINIGCSAHQPVVGRMCFMGQTGAVLAGRHDDIEPSACVHDRLGEDLVRPIRQTAYSYKRFRLAANQRANL